MLIGYARVSTADGSQSLDLQTDALEAAGVQPGSVYSDLASGEVDARPGLDACLKALRSWDMLVVWKLDRLGRSLRHLVNTVHDLTPAIHDLTPSLRQLAAGRMVQRPSAQGRWHTGRCWSQGGHQPAVDGELGASDVLPGR